MTLSLSPLSFRLQDFRLLEREEREERPERPRERARRAKYIFFLFGGTDDPTLKLREIHQQVGQSWQIHNFVSSLALRRPGTN